MNKGHDLTYLTAEETAERWQCSPVRVRELCREGRVPGAYRCNDNVASWRIPPCAVKPEDLSRARKDLQRKKAPQ